MRPESDEIGPLIVDPPCFFCHQPVQGARLRADFSAWFPGEDGTGEVSVHVDGWYRTWLCHPGCLVRFGPP